MLICFFYPFIQSINTEFLLVSGVSTLCVSHPVVSDSSRPHGLQPSRLLCPWDSLGKNTGVPFPLPGIFPTQGLNPSLLHQQADALLLSHQGSPSQKVTVWLIPLLSYYQLLQSRASLMVLMSQDKQERSWNSLQGLPQQGTTDWVTKLPVLLSLLVA